MRTKTPAQAEKMLDAAARLFGTQRFHEVRMDDIAAEAEVGKGTLYRYFSDKEDLYLALLGRASQQFLAELEAAMEGTADPRAKLEALVAATVNFFDEQPHVLDLIQRAEVLRGTGPNFPWQKARDEMGRKVLAVFDEARARGEFSVRDPELAMLLMLGGLRSVVRFGKRPRPRHLARIIVQGLLEGWDVAARLESTAR